MTNSESNRITEHYGKFNFSSKEREKLKDLDKRLKTLERLKNRQIKKRELIEENIAEFSKEKNHCWSKASDLLNKLQKRCKHEGGTYQRERYRDFGTDSIRTFCILCSKQLGERYKDD